MLRLRLLLSPVACAAALGIVFVSCAEPESAGTRDSGGDTSWCETGSVCSGACVDRTKDPLNCGACGRKCPTGQSCNEGLCKSCTAPSVDCTGTCIDITSDPKNCGGCKLACPGTQLCVASACSCGKLTVCGIDCVDTDTNKKHCGKCDNPCSSTEDCISGECK